MREVEIIKCIGCPLEDPTHLQMVKALCPRCKHFVMETDDAILCNYEGE